MYHNPLNTARGLVDALKQAIRTGDSKSETANRAELEAVAPEVEKMDTGSFSAEVHALYTEVRDEIGKLLDKKPPSKSRTAKAAAAPEKTDPPAAK